MRTDHVKLVSYEVTSPVGPIRRLGALTGQGTDIVDLNLAYYCLARASGSGRPREEADFFVPPAMLDFLSGGAQCLTAATQALAAAGDVDVPDGLRLTVPREAVRLLAPVPRPLTVRTFSVFEEHGLAARGGGRQADSWYRRPMAEKLMPAAVSGPDDALTWPYYTTQLDLQAGIGCYVGKQGRDLDLSTAAGHIAGWTIFIDPIARDGGRYAGTYKWRNFQSVMGPCLVTPDEFDETSAPVTIRVNGEVWFKGNTGQRRQFWAPALLAYTSDNETLHPGEFFGMGPIGSSSSLDLGRWVKPGDLYEVGVGGIGVIRSVVGDPQPRVVGWAADGMAPRTPIPLNVQ